MGIYCMKLSLGLSASLLSITVATALFSGAANAQANNFADISFAVQHDDNITRAFLSDDQLSDNSAHATLSAGRLLQLPNLDTFSLFAELGRHHFATLDGLNSSHLTLGASYQHKFGLGALAPTLSSSFSWTLEDSRTEIRSREFNTLDVNFRKRLSNAWDFSAGVSVENSDGKYDGAMYASMYSPDNDIFDFSQTSAFTGINYTFANYSTLNLSYSFIDGYTVSNALAPNPTLLAIADALTIDAAIPAPIGRNIVAYTLETSAHIWTLDWSYPIGRDTSISAAYSWQDISARAGVDYSNNRISLTLMHILK